MNPAKHFSALCLGIVIFCPGFVAADTVILRNGETLEGQVVNQSQASLILETEEGTRDIQKTRIMRIIYKDRKVESEDDNRTAREDEDGAKREIERQRIERERAQDERFKRLSEELESNQAENQSEESAKSPEDKDDKPKPDEESQPSLIPDPDPPRRSSINGWSALWRSALIPGWGQYEKGEHWKAGSFSLAMVGGAFIAYEGNRHYRQARKDLATNNNPFSSTSILASNFGASTYPSNSELLDPVYMYFYTEPFLSRQKSADRHYSQIQAAGVFLGLVYVWNLVDAFYSGNGSKSASREPGIRTGIQISYSPIDTERKFKRVYPVLYLQWSF